MVSPHANWEDEESGYRSAGVGIFVEPTSVEEGEAESAKGGREGSAKGGRSESVEEGQSKSVEVGKEGPYRASGGVSPDDAGAYAVDLRTGMGAETETRDPIAAFDDPRTAWEFAHLLTHYFEACSSARAARDDLLGDDPGRSSDAEPFPDLAGETDAEAAFRTFVHPYSIPESLRERLENGD